MQLLRKEDAIRDLHKGKPEGRPALPEDLRRAGMTDPLDTIERAISDLPELLVFEAKMLPTTTIGGVTYVELTLYVAAESASQAAEKAEATAEAQKKGKFRVGTLKRLGPLVR